MFYLIEIATGDSKIAGKAIYSYNSEVEATAVFHSKLGSAMKSDLYDSELVMVIDESGATIKKEKYIKFILEESLEDTI